jgi:hypothetical protein
MHLLNELNSQKASKILRVNFLIILSSLAFLQFFLPNSTIEARLALSFSFVGFSFWLFFHSYASLFPVEIYLTKSSQIYFVMMFLSALIIPNFRLTGLDSIVLWSFANSVSTVYIFAKMVKLKHIIVRGQLRVGKVFKKSELIRVTILVPIYVSVFDALKVDVIIVHNILGIEVLGLYAVMSSLCLIMGLLHRVFFILYLNLRKTFLHEYKSRAKLLQLFLLLNITLGIICAIGIDPILDLIASKQYIVNSHLFLFLWVGNLFYWARRLVYELFQDLDIGKFAVISEIVSSGLFLSLVFLQRNLTLKSFVSSYSLSLLIGFVLLSTAIYLNIKSEKNLQLE